MEIKHKEFNNKGAFFIEEDGDTLGKMTYSRTDKNHIVIEHTDVDVKLQGKGAGKQMLTKVVEWARENNIKIKPVCTFANSVFQKVKAFEDVLDQA
jgi:uncharacterized protein